MNSGIYKITSALQNAMVAAIAMPFDDEDEDE